MSVKGVRGDTMETETGIETKTETKMDYAKAGVDIKEVALGMGHDHRIGSNFLEAGIGYGGACLSKDVKAFISIAHELGIDFQILKETEAVNQARISQFVDKVKRALPILKGKTICKALEQG